MSNPKFKLDNNAPTVSWADSRNAESSASSQVIDYNPHEILPVIFIGGFVSIQKYCQTQSFFLTVFVVIRFS